MFKKLVAFAAVLLIGVTAMLGCSTNYAQVPFEAQNTEYMVVGNGGSAVQYGNYVYFINGTRGYEDTEGDANMFGEVIKGALYRARLSGTAETLTIAEGVTTEIFVASRTAEGAMLTLHTAAADDYKGNETMVADGLELIAPKVIGTSGYSGGGIYIFDEYLYYATPHNQRDKTSNVKYEFTDFMRVNLKTGRSQLLYTADVDTAASPYMFFSRGETIVLTVLEGTDLMSLTFNKNNGRKQKTLKLEQGVTGAVFPSKPVYYKGIPTDTIYDFIYYSMAPRREEGYLSGETLTFMRPDGSVLDPAEGNATRRIFRGKSGVTYALVGVRDGLLYYTMSGTTQHLCATNLHNELKYDAAYAQSHADVKDFEDKNVFAAADISTLSFYPFVSSYDFIENEVKRVYASNSVQVVAAGTGESANLELYKDGKLQATIASGAASLRMETVYKNVLVYSEASTLYRVDLSPGSSYAPITVSSSYASGTYGAEVCADYLVYFATVSDNALSTGYTHFTDLNANEGSEHGTIFVGVRIEDELPSIYETLEVVSDPDKKIYKLNESKLDVTGFTIRAIRYLSDAEAEAGADPQTVEPIAVTKDMVTGFDTTAAGTNTITITYEGQTMSYDLTVSEEAASGCGSVVGVSGGIAGAIALAGAAVVLRKKRRHAN